MAADGKINGRGHTRSALQGEISALQVKISALQVKISALQGEISALQREVSTQRRGISALHWRYLLCMANMLCKEKYLLCKGKICSGGEINFWLY